MPHQCLKCGTIYKDGSSQLLKGCSDCGGNRFFYTKTPLSEEQRAEIQDEIGKDLNEQLTDLFKNPENKEFIDYRDNWITMKPKEIRRVFKKHMTESNKKLQETNEQQEQKRREHKALQKKKEFYRKKEKEQQEVKTRIESHNKEQLLEEKELEDKEQLLKKNPSIEFNLNLFQSIENQRKTLYQSYQQLIKKTSKVKDILSKQILSIEKKQSNIALLIQEINSIKKQRNELKEMHDKIKNEQQKIVEISMLKEIMVSFRLHLVSRIRPALSQYASSFFHDLTDGKYPEMTLDDQYNINIYDDGKKYPIQRFSGGEIDLANLCLRLAISDVITERAEGLFHFIILDEIFGSQDRLRQQNIMQELYKLSSTFKQIFLITHVEEIKHYLQHIIQVEETNDESIIIIN